MVITGRLSLPRGVKVKRGIAIALNCQVAGERKMRLSISVENRDTNLEALALGAPAYEVPRFSKEQWARAYKLQRASKGELNVLDAMEIVAAQWYGRNHCFHLHVTGEGEGRGFYFSHAEHDGTSLTRQMTLGEAREYFTID